MKKKVIIVGGGASGLVCAIRLKQVAPDIKITILEKSDRVGKNTENRERSLQFKQLRYETGLL